jgi:hypothetical protein
MPKLTITVRDRAAFSDGMYLDPGTNYRHNRPSPFEAPRHLLFISVKNERKAPVKIKRIGIHVHDRFDDFLGEDLGLNHLFPRLPLTLPGFDQIEFYVAPQEVRHILQALFAGADSFYTLDVIDGIDRRYSSAPMKASERLTDSGGFNAILRVHAPITITIGEEEYFPDGFVPEGYDPEPSA